MNYGSKYGWKPIQVDLDSDQQSLGNPSCVVASIDQIYGGKKQKICFYLGHPSNPTLLKFT